MPTHHSLHFTVEKNPIHLDFDESADEKIFREIFNLSTEKNSVTNEKTIPIQALNIKSFLSSVSANDPIPYPPVSLFQSTPHNSLGNFSLFEGDLLKLKAESKQTNDEADKTNIKNIKEVDKTLADEAREKGKAEREEQRKSQQAQNVSWWSKLFGAIISAVAAVAAAALTAVTFGAAAPLAVIAITAAVVAVYDLTAMIVLELGGPDISIENGIKKIAMDWFNADEETASKIAMGLGIGLRIGLAVGSGVGAYRAAGVATGSVVGIMSKVTITTEMVGAATTITGSTAAIFGAQREKGAALLRSDQEEINNKIESNKVSTKITIDNIKRRNETYFIFFEQVSETLENEHKIRMRFNNMYARA